MDRRRPKGALPSTVPVQWKPKTDRYPRKNQIFQHKEQGIWHKNQIFRHIEQGSDIIKEEKVSNIYYNTVATFYI